LVSTQRKLWRSQIKLLYTQFEDVLHLSTTFGEKAHIKKYWTHFKKKKLELISKFSI